MPALRWLVPLTVAATAFVIWVALPSRAPIQQSDSPAAAVDQVAPAPRPGLTEDARAKVRAEAQPQSQVASGQHAAATPQPPVALREGRKPRRSTSRRRRRRRRARSRTRRTSLARHRSPTRHRLHRGTGRSALACRRVDPRRQATSANERLSAFANALEA
jgi:hypothetical protein